MTLGIKDANPAPGAQVWQLPADGSTARDFSFEDAGNGFFYIRSHVSGLYLTMHVPTPASAGGPGPIPQPIPPTVIQDVKVVPGTTPASPSPADADPAVTVPLPAVARQQWVLRPSDPIQAGPVVLRAITLGHPLGLDPWKITSPALSG